MCTVTWLRSGDGYQLLCNRDERNSRQPALGPRQREQNGVKYIAPVDGDHGGSWIGANEFGLSLCLLNRYGELDLKPNQNYISRGLLLLDLLDSPHVEQIMSRVNEMALDRFRPFNLLALSPHKSALVEWTGSEYSIVDDADRLLPLTSTSLKEPGIAIARQQQFAALTATQTINESLLDAFHRGHLPDRGAYSVCMHRDDAATVSLSKIKLSQDEIVFEYESDSPCKRNAVATIRMATRKL